MEDACKELVTEATSRLKTPGLKIVVDLKNILYISSAGLGSLMIIHEKAQANGCIAYIINASPAVKKLLKITSMGSVLNIRQSKEEVLAGTSP